MTRLVSSELMKLRTARTFWGMAAVTLGLAVLVTVLTLALSSNFGSPGDVRSLLSTGFVSGLLMLVMGVVFTAGEYRHGTIAWTLLVTPDRLRALAAQTLAAAIFGLVVGALTMLVTAAIALPWLATKDAATLPTADVLRILYGGVLFTGLAAALGAAVGALLRNQVAAVVLVLVLLFVVDPALAALVDDYARYSLQGLGISLTGGSADDIGTSRLLPFGVAALVWSGYTVALVSVASVLTSRRDI